MTTTEVSNGNPPAVHRPCSVDGMARVPDVVRHLTVALSRHVRQLHQAGLRVPPDLEELAGLLMHLASIRQGLPPVADTLEATPPGQRPDRLLVTKKEASERLGVSVRTLERLVATGQLPQVHVERLARFRVIDLEAYVSGLADNQAPGSDPRSRASG